MSAEERGLPGDIFLDVVSEEGNDEAKAFKMNVSAKNLIYVYYTYAVRSRFRDRLDYLPGSARRMSDDGFRFGVDTVGAAISSPKQYDEVSIPTSTIKGADGNVIAFGLPRILAHELGHVLELDHKEDSEMLMNVPAGTVLTEPECKKARTTLDIINSW